MTIKITVRGDSLGDVEKALKVLKKKLDRTGIFKLLKERRFFEKPSAKKRRKRQEAERKRKQKKKYGKHKR